MRNVLCVYVNVIKIDIEVQASPSDRLTFITPSVPLTFPVCFPFSINLYLARQPHILNHASARRNQRPWQSNHRIDCIFSFFVWPIYLFFVKIPSICFHWPWSWFYLGKCQNHYTGIRRRTKNLNALSCIACETYESTGEIQINRMHKQNRLVSAVISIGVDLLSLRAYWYNSHRKMSLAYAHHTDSSETIANTSMISSK